MRKLLQRKWFRHHVSYLVSSGDVLKRDDPGFAKVTKVVILEEVVLSTLSLDWILGLCDARLVIFPDDGGTIHGVTDFFEELTEIHYSAASVEGCYEFGLCGGLCNYGLFVRSPVYESAT